MTREWFRAFAAHSFLNAVLSDPGESDIDIQKFSDRVRVFLAGQLVLRLESLDVVLESGLQSTSAFFQC